MLNEAQGKAAYLVPDLVGLCERHPNKPYDHPPVEAAALLADRVWVQVAAHAEAPSSVAVNCLFKIEAPR